MLSERQLVGTGLILLFLLIAGFVGGMGYIIYLLVSFLTLI